VLKDLFGYGKFHNKVCTYSSPRDATIYTDLHADDGDILMHHKRPSHPSLSIPTTSRDRHGRFIITLIMDLLYSHTKLVLKVFIHLS
jgi:hypothetical protein